MKLSEAFRVLQKHYGNHSRAANAAKISVRSYRDYRNKGNVPEVKAGWIMHLATELKKLQQLERTMKP